MFRVRRIGIDDGSDCFVVGIAEDADGAGRCYLFQEPVDEDLVAESSTYCVVDETERLVDGGVASVDIAGGVLTISFTAGAAEALGLDDPVATFPLDVSRDDVLLLADGLRRVLSYGDDLERPTFRVEVDSD